VDGVVVCAAEVVVFVPVGGSECDVQHSGGVAVGREAGSGGIGAGSERCGGATGDATHYLSRAGWSAIPAGSFSGRSAGTFCL